MLYQDNHRHCLSLFAINSPSTSSWTSMSLPLAQAGETIFCFIWTKWFHHFISLTWLLEQAGNFGKTKLPTHIYTHLFSANMPDFSSYAAGWQWGNHQRWAGQVRLNQVRDTLKLNVYWQEILIEKDLLQLSCPSASCWSTILCSTSSLNALKKSLSW